MSVVVGDGVIHSLKVQGNEQTVVDRLLAAIGVVLFLEVDDAGVVAASAHDSPGERRPTELPRRVAGRDAHREVTP